MGGSLYFQDGWDKNNLGMRGSINFHDGQGFILPKNLGMRGSLNFQDGWDKNNQKTLGCVEVYISPLVKVKIIPPVLEV